MAETFVYSVVIRTTPEKLWEALVSGDFTEQYWFGFRLEADLRKGGTIRVSPPKGKEHYGGVFGEILEYDPPRRLRYTFGGNDRPEVAGKRQGPSRVSFELIPMGPLVKLHLVHENLLPEDQEKDARAHRGVNNGWPAILSSLKSLLETGRALSFEI